MNTISNRTLKRNGLSKNKFPILLKWAYNYHKPSPGDKYVSGEDSLIVLFVNSNQGVRLVDTANPNRVGTFGDFALIQQDNWAVFEGSLEIKDK